MDQIARTPKQLGAIIQRRRGLLRMNQSQAGDRAGLRQEMVSKIESGSPGTAIRTICDLLAALDLELRVADRSRESARDIEEVFS